MKHIEQKRELIYFYVHIKGQEANSCFTETGQMKDWQSLETNV